MGKKAGIFGVGKSESESESIMKWWILWKPHRERGVEPGFLFLAFPASRVSLLSVLTHPHIPLRPFRLDRFYIKLWMVMKMMRIKMA